MAIYLLDTSVIIDTLNGKRGRRELLEQLLVQGNLLGCCAISVAEVYAGMRPHEARATDALLDSLQYLDIDRQTARLAGRIKYEEARKGRSISLADAMIAAVALHHEIVLLTDNVRHRMRGLRLYPLN